MTPLELKETILTDYMNQYGLVTIPHGGVDGPGGGNVLLHTGLFYTIIGLHGLLDNADSWRWVSALEACRVKDSTGRKILGLYWRSPDKIGDRQAHDDYIGIASASVFVDQGMEARLITSHGKQNYWFYDSISATSGSRDPDTWHDRFPGLTAFYRLCAGEPVSIWEKLTLAGSIIGKSFGKDDADSKIMGFIMVKAALKRSAFFIPVDIYWTLRMKSMYGSIPESWRGYFHDHPFTQLRLD